MDTKALSYQALECVRAGVCAFCKFITANEVGSNGSHQEGFYIPKSAVSIAFDTVGIKGENKERLIRIEWSDGLSTDSRFIYYGKGSRNEYRLTRFGRGFPYLRDEYLGALFVLVHMQGDLYRAYVLSSDEDVETFLEGCGITISQTNALIDRSKVIQPTEELNIQSLVQSFVCECGTFPNTQQMAQMAHRISVLNKGMPYDEVLLKWVEDEYSLFKEFERVIYASNLGHGFASIEELVEVANTILNRRKSRAGKSLEHHLSAVFERAGLLYQAQVVTEGNKRPDFIFPSADAYHDPMFGADGLVFLAAKTTCKDRWRQILNEADRIPIKHLFTLQQGISSAQLEEMNSHGVKLVVPERYRTCFPKRYQQDLLSLGSFVDFVGRKQQYSYT